MLKNFQVSLMFKISPLTRKAARKKSVPASLISILAAAAVADSPHCSNVRVVALHIALLTFLSPSEMSKARKEKFSLCPAAERFVIPGFTYCQIPPFYDNICDNPSPAQWCSLRADTRHHLVWREFFTPHCRYRISPDFAS